MGSWKRRHVLRALGGVALALPLLELTGGPASALPFPKRLVIVFTGNGTVKSAWSPAPPANDPTAETDFDLSPILAPLAPHRDHLLILEGIDMESSYHGTSDAPHSPGMGNLLTGTELVNPEGAGYWGGGISVDQRIAQAVGGATKLGSLELGVQAGISGIYTRMSYLGPAQPVPPLTDPWQAYARLFGQASPTLIAQRRSVLDAVAGDLDALAARLSADDRHKLGAHLAAVRGVESRLGLGGACAPPPFPPRRPILVSEAAPGSYPFEGQLLMDLLVTALACDLTRVATLQWSHARSLVQMSWLGIDEPHHTLSHRPDDDAPAQQALTDINRWYAERFAALLSAMRAVPEGDGTLLDHSVVVWCNELSQGNTHDRRDLRYVLAGGCGGYFKTGRWLRYGGAAAGDVHNNLLVSLCNAMDLDVTTFGNPAYCTGPLRWLRG